MTVFWQQKHAIKEHACDKKASFYVRIKQHSDGTTTPCGHNGDSVMWGHICASNAACHDSKLSAECRYAWQHIHGSTAAASNDIWMAVLRAATRTTSTAVKRQWAFRSKHSDRGVAFDPEILLACASSHGSLIYRKYDECKMIALEVVSEIVLSSLTRGASAESRNHAGIYLLVLGSFWDRWLRIRALNSIIQNDRSNMTDQYLKISYLGGWNMILGGFWGRWLRIRAQNLEIQKNGYNMTVQNANSYLIGMKFRSRAFLRWLIINSSSSFRNSK